MTIHQLTPPELFELLIEAEEEAAYRRREAQFQMQIARYWEEREAVIRRMLRSLEQAENVAASCCALQELE